MKLLGAKLAEISQRDIGIGTDIAGAGGGYDPWGSPLLKPAHLECDSTVLHSNIVNNLNRTTFADIEPLMRDPLGGTPSGVVHVVLDGDTSSDLRHSSSLASGARAATVRSDSAFKV